MKKYVYLLMLLVLVGITSCSPDEIKEIEEIEQAELNGKSVEISEDTKRITYRLDEADVPGVSGFITLRDAGQMGVEAVLKLENTTPGGMHPVHIHEGLVGQDGPRAKTLSPVNGTTGISHTYFTTMDNGEPADFLNLVKDQEYYVGPHLSHKEMETLLAVGQIGVANPPAQCVPCDGNLERLAFLWLGKRSRITVTQKNGDVIFDQNVRRSDQFTVFGQDSDGTLGEEIIISVDGVETTVIETDCDRPVLVGMNFGEFFVTDGASAAGPLCEIDDPEACNDCDGYLNSLSFEYTGDSGDRLKIVQDKDDEVLFDDVVQNGQIIKVDGRYKDGRFGSSIDVFVNNHFVQEISAKCDDGVEVGAVFGNLVVTAGMSTKGGPLCDNNNPSNRECAECDGYLNSLSFEYNGDSGDRLKIVQDKDHEVVFDEVVQNGQIVTINGRYKDGRFGSYIEVFVNDQFVQEISAKCDDNIGVGSVFGDLTVTAGNSTKGGPLCEIEDPADQPCDECDGYLNSLTFEYTGDSGERLRLVQDKDEIVLFDEVVSNGQIIMINGRYKDGRFGSYIEVFVNGHFVREISAKCDDNIGVGSVFGDLTVTAGRSTKGGPLCEIDNPVDPNPGSGDCDECDGNVDSLTFEFTGNSGTRLKVVQDKDDQVIFDEVVQNGQEIALVGRYENDGSFGKELKIFENGHLVEEIHTSCSDPIGVGSVYGNLTVLAGSSTEGGPLCEIENPVDPNPGSGDCNECDGNVDSLTFEFTGDSGTRLKVVQDKDGQVIFDEVVQNGQEIALVGQYEKDGSFGKELKIFEDGHLTEEIHTSCSDPIGVGSVYGNLTVLAGSSTDGGALCEI